MDVLLDLFDENIMITAAESQPEERNILLHEMWHSSSVHLKGIRDSRG
jgi:hypothetical protein